MTLEDGLHLVSEKKPERSYAILEKRQATGSPALVITREHPEKVAKKRDPEAAAYYWLSLKRTLKSLHPRNLRRIQRTVDRFLRDNPNGTVLLDGMEFLYQENGYAKVFSFLENLESVTKARGGGVIVPMDLRVLGLTRTMEVKDRFAFVEVPATP